MTMLLTYFQTWKRKLSHITTVTAAFHLSNREAQCELNVYNSDTLLLFGPTPTCFVVKLDRLLTSSHHLVPLRKAIFSCHTVQAICRLWIGYWCHTGRIAALSGLLNSCVLHLSLVSQRYICLIDSVLNDVLRIVTGFLHPTPTDHLPILLGIQLA